MPFIVYIPRSTRDSRVQIMSDYLYNRLYVNTYAPKKKVKIIIAPESDIEL